MPTSGLQELFSKELQFLYNAHQQSAKQAGSIGASIASPKLKRMFDTGAKVNTKQAKRLERVFTVANRSPSQRHDLVLAGIGQASRAAVEELTNPVERDLSEIAAAQMAIHTFIARYGTLQAYALNLGYKKAAALLKQSLDENVEGDKRFSQIAQGIVRRAQKGEDQAKGGSGFPRAAFRFVLISGLVAAGLNEAKKRNLLG